MPIHQNEYGRWLDDGAWSKWSTNALTLIETVFGTQSTTFQNLDRVCKAYQGGPDSKDKAFGIFRAAKEDFEKGFTRQLEKQISGEIFGDFVVLAKTALAEGKKDVAAVLACAALEDALKRYATLNGLDAGGKTMDNVVGMLKSAGLVQGAQKSLLDAMPRVRNCAMHADWAKISEPEVHSVISFVESFLQTKF